MKCTSKSILCLLGLVIITSTGCSTSKYDIPYAADSKISSFNIVNIEDEDKRADLFAKKLCIVDSDVAVDTIEIKDGVAAGMFDVTHQNTIYAKNIHERMYPASLTKVTTALVALKNSSLDTVLTASANCYISEAGAQTIGISEGDQMTLEQALNLLLIYSANDVAVMIAENIGGTVENFVDMMNKEAVSCGASMTHYMNPHGLSADNHYTTPYDMYLIMNEAVQFDAFKKIINTNEYETVYYDIAGNEKEIKCENTNLYITGEKQAPAGITVIGGKTGTTNAAGHCLVVISNDDNSNTYISVVMKSDRRDSMYSYMNSLLDKANES